MNPPQPQLHLSLQRRKRWICSVSDLPASDSPGAAGCADRHPPQTLHRLRWRAAGCGLRHLWRTKAIACASEW